MHQEPARSLDLRGALCPMNFVRIKLELDKLGPGVPLHVTADGGDTGRDILRSLESQGFVVSAVQSRDETLTFVVYAPAAQA